MKILEIKPLRSFQMSEVLVLDQICLGGLWTEDGYLREIDSPKSSLLVMSLTEPSNQEQKKPIIIGVCCLWAIVNEAHITLLAIHPDHRRQGLGQLLLLTILKNAIARQLDWATLEVNVNNQGAINLYQKFGFRVAGTRKNYYQPSGDDALVLWLKGLRQSNVQANLKQWQRRLQQRLSQNYCYLK
ncbi:MAG: N-acetyltransferase [Cyanobacteria bacterium J06621_8]